MNSADTGDDRGLGFERLVFFSDAVFAIAITVLVLNLKPADAVAGGVMLWKPLQSKLFGFGLSFYVIGRYWMAHHQLFETIRRYDTRLMVVNLVFLAAIVFVPFATSVAVDSPPTRGPMIFYFGSLLLVAVLMVALIITARRPALMKPGENLGGTVRTITNASVSPLVFLLVIAIAVANSRIASWFLLLLIPAGQVSGRLGRALEARANAATSRGSIGAAKPPPGASAQAGSAARPATSAAKSPAKLPDRAGSAAARGTPPADGDAGGE